MIIEKEWARFHPHAPDPTRMFTLGRRHYVLVRDEIVPVASLIDCWGENTDDVSQATAIVYGPTAAYHYYSALVPTQELHS